MAGSSAGWSEPIVFMPDSPRNKMAKRRKKAQAGRRPTMSLSDLRKATQRRRDAEMDARYNSPLSKRSREKIRAEGR